jgi:hypothetical protein
MEVGSSGQLLSVQLLFPRLLILSAGPLNVGNDQRTSLGSFVVFSRSDDAGFVGAAALHDCLDSLRYVAALFSI